MAEDRLAELEKRLALAEDARRELAEQVEHLVELLAFWKREVARLASLLEKRGRAPEE